MITIYRTKEEVLKRASQAVGKTLKNFITQKEDLKQVMASIEKYGTNRKGYLGNLVEKYIFGLDVNNLSEADFKIAGVELKTTPIKKHPRKTYISKERLVFSIIDYKNIVDEEWETSSFLEKNSLLLLMFYLYEIDKNLLDYEFKFARLLDLLTDLSIQDVEQIKKDWEFIVAKIKRGEAHLLSEGDTFYLGACTKAKNSSVVRDQPNSRQLAKPRAFSLKQTYLNYIIQRDLLGRGVDVDSIFKGKKIAKTVEEAILGKFSGYIGKTDKEIVAKTGWSSRTMPKNFKRLLVNHILTGSGSNRVEELEKANITLKVITLESSGVLKESLSFPAFDYKDLVTQVWYDEKNEIMSDFHAQLEMKKFLFVVFKKIKNSDDIRLEKLRFWNFPMKDIAEAERVFDKTIDCINKGRYENLPKISESRVAHVRPHGKNASDTAETPQGTKEIKRCFWLNAKYIEEALKT